MLRKFRLTSQIFFFALFCVLFFFYSDLASDEASSSGLAWYLRMNHYTFMITSIASRSIVEGFLIVAAIMLLINLFFGRLFCGAICPLGSMIDFFDKIFRGKEDMKQKHRPKQYLQKLKYIFMFVFIVMALLGVTYPLFMDPLDIVPRIFGEIVEPAVYYTLDIFGIGGRDISRSHDVIKGGFAGAMTTYILFVIVIGGSLVDRRFWCQYVCPSGAFFGVLSKFTIFRRKTTHSCDNCKECSFKMCPTQAIDRKNFSITNTAECIVCGACTSDPKHCNEFAIDFSMKNSDQSISRLADISRRNVTVSLVSGVFLLPVLARPVPSKKNKDLGLLRPPGSVSEEEFLDRCITCAACITVCPERVLYPAPLSDGIVNWNTPKFVPRKGMCVEDCNQCSTACPTGAIEPFSVKEKAEKTKVGVAFVFKDTCLPWIGGHRCLVCIKKCPYDAFEKVKVTVQGKKMIVPEVIEKACIGCGICEYVCPVIEDNSAVRVFAQNEKRRDVHKKIKKKKEKAEAVG